MDGAPFELRRLVAEQRCRCGGAYDGGAVNVLGRQDDVWIITVPCHRCRSRWLAAALLRAGRVTFTDLLPGEDRPASEPVTAEDLLAMQAFLRDFEGDVFALFRAARADAADHTP